MGNKLVKSSLKHAGVKGMEWGKRKKETTNPRSPEYKKPTPVPIQSYPSISELTRKPTLSNFLPIPEWTRQQRQDRAKQEIKEDVANRITDFNQIPRFDPATESLDDTVLKVNEGYGYSSSAIDMGENTWSNNCPSASFAYELRRRGYDVETGLTGGLNSYQIGSMWGISIPEIVAMSTAGFIPKTTKQVTAEIEAMGPGARGFCIMQWKNMRSGHISSFEVDAKGKAVFIDAQTGKSSRTEPKDSDDNPANYCTQSSNYFVVRVDNRKPNEKKLKNMVRLDDRQQAPVTKVAIGKKKVNSFITDEKIKSFVVDKTKDYAKKKVLNFLTKNKGASVK